MHMPSPQTHAHEQIETLAASSVGDVKLCSCGVLTLSLQYLSLRFEPAAFRELTALLAQADQGLSRVRDSAPGPSAVPAPASHVH
jgi:hypothetical protein